VVRDSPKGGVRNTPEEGETDYVAKGSVGQLEGGVHDPPEDGVRDTPLAGGVDNVRGGPVGQPEGGVRDPPDGGVRDTPEGETDSAEGVRGHTGGRTPLPHRWPVAILLHQNEARMALVPQRLQPLPHPRPRLTTGPLRIHPH
jgi:hypothetical protein